MTEKPRALALISGGLDSALAVRVLLEQGAPVTALHFVSVFSSGADPQGRLAARVVADGLGVPLIVRDATRAMLDFVPAPRFGWGKHMNPCIDCHAFQIAEARKLMGELGASYVATGEVLGQRPMSQHREALDKVSASSGLDGFVLRPLSARLLEPTEPEKRGWIDRERLLGISGRTRSVQNELAAKWNLSGFTSPAGGCLLTDAQFSRRLQDLLDCGGRLDANEGHLLRFGRHFRLGPKTRAILGRNMDENAAILTYAREGDWLLVTREEGSPEAILRGDVTEEHVVAAAGLVAAFSRCRADSEVFVEAMPYAKNMYAPGATVSPRSLAARPADAETIERLWIRRPEKQRGRRK